MRHRILALLAVLGLLALSGCADLQDVPMPALVSGDKYQVTAVFTNVLGLPEQSAVKLDGATIGEITSIRTVDYTARVGLAISSKYDLPADVRAQVRFGSPMGEAFVELSVPKGGGTGHLAPGGTIGLADTSQAPSVADMLTAVSTLVTGSSFGDMKVVITELNHALRGNSGNIRTLIGRLDGMVRRLNDHTHDFDVALDSMDRLGAELAGDRALLARSLRGFEPAVRTLSQERGQVLTLMTQLRRLSSTGTTTLDASRAGMLSTLRDLGPILQTLTDNQARFQPIFDGIHRFGAATTAATWGLFLNFDLTTVVDPAVLVSSLGSGQVS